MGCKANGQYDLIIEYDSYMHALEEKERSHREKQMKKVGFFHIYTVRVNSICKREKSRAFSFSACA